MVADGGWAPWGDGAEGAGAAQVVAEGSAVLVEEPREAAAPGEVGSEAEWIERKICVNWLYG